jgi:hypothetical protein
VSLFLGRPYADESVCSMYSVPPIDCLRVAVSVVVVQQHEPMRAFWRHPEKTVRRAGDSKNRRFSSLAYRSRAVWLLSTLTSLTAATANPPKCNEGFFLLPTALAGVLDDTC